MRPIKVISLEKVFLILFCGGSVLFFSIFYCNHLYQREQLQLFELTFSYLIKNISTHGGLAIYLGEFLTQFFSVPVAGALIITSLLFLLQKSTNKLLYLVSQNSNLAAFSILPALGYFILLTQQFYYISGLIGLLLSIIASNFYLNQKRIKSRILTAILLIPGLYWLTGGAFLVFVINILISDIFLNFRKRKNDSAGITLIAVAVYLSLAIVIPLLARHFLFTDTFLQAYLSEAYYAIRIFCPLLLIIVFLSVPFLIIIHSFLPVNISARQNQLINFSFIIIAVCISVLGISSVSDFKAEKEMTYENLVYKKNWKKILDKAEKENPSDKVSMLSVNLALAETGQLSSKMFHFNQNQHTLFPGYERRGMTPFIANEIFFHLGLINFAQMFALETIESTPDAKYPARAFKRVAETFMINGQYDIALKYLTPLSHTMFYRRWAKDYISILNDEKKINADLVLSSKRAALSRNDFYYNSKQTDIMLRYYLVSSAGNRVAYEYLMANDLLNKDLDAFIADIKLADGFRYEILPIVWQEASAYIQTRLSESPPQLKKYPVGENVIKDIKSYAQLFSNKKQDTAGIKKEFGNTYWYYLHFK